MYLHIYIHRLLLQQQQQQQQSKASTCSRRFDTSAAPPPLLPVAQQQQQQQQQAAVASWAAFSAYADMSAAAAAGGSTVKAWEEEYVRSLGFASVADACAKAHPPAHTTRYFFFCWREFQKIKFFFQFFSAKSSLRFYSRVKIHNFNNGKVPF